MKKIVLLSVTSALLMVGGIKSPFNSLDSVALSGANVAGASGADAAYNNPANMVFEKPNRQIIEIGASYVGSGEVSVADSTGTVTNSSEAQSNFNGNIHYLAPAIEKMRFGMSLVSPSVYSSAFKDANVSVYTTEFNPSVAYRINKDISAAFGLRAVNSDIALNDKKSSQLDFGYNLAFAYRPMKGLSLALTHRSEVTKVNMPADITFATSYDVSNWGTLFEFTYEYNMWSSLTENYQDTSTVRLGATQMFGRKWKGMFGFAYDASPVTAEKINPSAAFADSDSLIFSGGAKWAISRKYSAGFAALYDMKGDVTDENTPANTYAGMGAYMVTANFEYKF